MGIFFRKHKITGVFRYHDDLEQGVRALMQSPFAIDRIYSPVPEEEIYALIGMKRSRLRFFPLFGGLTGGLIALGIAIYSAMRWKFIIQGKPVLGWPSFSLVTYEYTLIWAAIYTFIGVLVLGRIPSAIQKTRDDRFSDDQFGLRIECRAAEREDAAELLRRNGAIDVYEENP
jgi:Alternative complex III, ActD subunit